MQIIRSVRLVQSITCNTKSGTTYRQHLRNRNRRDRNGSDDHGRHLRMKVAVAAGTKRVASDPLHRVETTISAAIPDESMGTPSFLEEPNFTQVETSHAAEVSNRENHTWRIIQITDYMENHIAGQSYCEPAVL